MMFDRPPCVLPLQPVPLLTATTCRTQLTTDVTLVMQRLQTVLLGIKVPSLRYDVTIYTLYAIGVFMLIWALAEVLK